MREAGRGVSRRDFLRAAGAVGVSGGLLGAHAKGALGQDHGAHEMEMGTGMSHGGNGTAGDVDLSRFDPTEFLRDFDYGQERREGGGPSGSGSPWPRR